MNLPKFVRLTEVGPRDGLQNERVAFATAEKVALIEALAAAGLTEIEITSFVNPKSVPQLADAEEVAHATRELPIVRFALVGNAKGYERARRAGVNGITVVLSATDTHNRKNLNRTTRESLAELEPILSSARNEGLATRVSISMAFGCPFEGKPEVDHVMGLIDTLARSGARRFGLCDTIGIANPRQVYALSRRIQAEFEGFDFELHFHNTYGRALANIMAAMQAGIRRFDTCVGGLGGCPFAPGATGNVATEDVASMLAELEIETGLDLPGILQASDFLSSKLERGLESGVWRVHAARHAPGVAARSAMQ
jgi:hydroxymethylglutaryl-CoA lyase